MREVTWMRAGTDAVRPHFSLSLNSFFTVEAFTSHPRTLAVAFQFFQRSLTPTYLCIPQ